MSHTVTGASSLRVLQYYPRSSFCRTISVLSGVIGIIVCPIFVLSLSLFRNPSGDVDLPFSLLIFVAYVFVIFIFQILNIIAASTNSLERSKRFSKLGEKFVICIAVTYLPASMIFACFLWENFMIGKGGGLFPIVLGVFILPLGITGYGGLANFFHIVSFQKWSEHADLDLSRMRQELEACREKES